MRRRRFGFRKRRVERVKYAWDSVIFNEDAILVNGALTHNIISDPSTLQSSGVATNQVIRYRRVMFRGGITLASNEADPVVIGEAFALFWMLCAVDRESGDATIIATAGVSDAVNELRVFAVGCEPFINHRRAPVAAGPWPGGTWNAKSGVESVRLDIDQKINFKAKPDDLIVLTVEYSQDLSLATGSSTLSDSRIFGFARALYELP